MDYLAMLSRANARFNLVSRRAAAPEALFDRHLMDSLRAATHLLGPRVADVGSGAGLPGIPLAIMCPDLDFTLIERSARRCDFLRHVKLRLGLGNVQVVEQDASNGQLRGSFNTALARALARPCRALGLLKPLVMGSGRVVLFVGAQDVDYLEAEDGCSVVCLRPTKAHDLVARSE